MLFVAFPAGITGPVDFVLPHAMRLPLLICSLRLLGTPLLVSAFPSEIRCLFDADFYHLKQLFAFKFSAFWDLF